MMRSLEHTVYLYASEDNEAAVTESVPCISKAEQEEFLKHYEWYPREYYKMPYDENLLIWKLFNYRVIREIKKRYEKGDIICFITGLTQKEVIHEFPYASVEYGIGYTGIHANFRVYESYAWMHYLYGRHNLYANRQYDEVIPNYFEREDFPFNDKKEDYLLFMSRPIPQKGLSIALEMAKRSGTKLIVAGSEKVEGENVEWVGPADTKKRAELMGKAKALLCPTLYVEPFGGVVVEAQLTGTPVITTDWGVFSENVVHGETGFRCHTIDEFLEAEKMVKGLDPRTIRSFAMRYDVSRVKWQYDRYFRRLHKMWKTIHII